LNHIEGGEFRGYVQLVAAVLTPEHKAAGA
jgi:hypothetical protein